MDIDPCHFNRRLDGVQLGARGEEELYLNPVAHVHFFRKVNEESPFAGVDRSPRFWDRCVDPAIFQRQIDGEPGMPSLFKIDDPDSRPDVVLVALFAVPIHFDRPSVMLLGAGQAPIAQPAIKDCMVSPPIRTALRGAVSISDGLHRKSEET